jgi:hypothetical protein
MVEVNYRFRIFINSGSEKLKSFRVSLQKSIEANKFDKAIKNNVTIRNAMRNFQNAIDVLESRHDLKDLTPEPKKFKDDLLIQLGRKTLIKSKEIRILDYFNRKIEKSEDEVGLGK